MPCRIAHYYRLGCFASPDPRVAKGAFPLLFIQASVSIFHSRLADRRKTTMKYSTAGRAKGSRLGQEVEPSEAKMLRHHQRNIITIIVIYSIAKWLVKFVQ